MPIAIGQKLESDFRNPLGLVGGYHSGEKFMRSAQATPAA